MSDICEHCECAQGHHLFNCSTLENIEAPVAEPSSDGIYAFHGPHMFLSNFWSCDVEFESITYASTEHAYQAAKTHDPVARARISTAQKPGEAKRLGTHVVLRPDWEEVKLGIMEGLLQQKFEPGTELGEKLRATGSKILVEGNRWHDVWWGVCVCKKHDGKGRNELGKLLMKIRSGL